MQISAATTTMPSRASEPSAPSAPVSDVPVQRADPVSVRRVAALLTMLENKPEIRPEVVARGRALASDLSYPPPDVISKLADLIVGDVP
jgi:hypothetical protein